MVSLDFRDQLISVVIDVISNRSGKRVVRHRDVLKASVPELPEAPIDVDSPITLVAREPVPFWDAIDRLAESAKLGWRLREFGETGFGSCGVNFDGSPFEAQLTQYSGPFRVALTGVHEHREVLFVRAPWVEVYPSGYHGPADAISLASAPRDGGDFYAELIVLPEPGLVCRRDGPLSEVKAIDELGRSLVRTLDGRANVSEALYWQLSSADIQPTGIHYPSVAIRIPLRQSDKPARMIKRLAGSIPVEIATLNDKPAVVLPLAGAEGKEVVGGGVRIKAETARFEADGHVNVSLVLNLVDDFPPPLRSARIRTILAHQYRFIATGGARVEWARSSSGGDGKDGIRLTGEYVPRQGGGPPPAEFRFYDLNRTKWSIPFEFHDVPLP
jgi:hypothetical protein